MFLKKLLLLIVFISSSAIQAQFGPQQIIDQDQALPSRAIPYDVNNDGFIDIIASLGIESRIVWYQNLDGLGNFAEKQYISDVILAIIALELYDINGDGLLDLIYTTNLDKIAWLENLDGQGNFGPEQLISINLYPYSLAIGDMDNDGDLDILSVVHNSGSSVHLMLNENIDGLGNFSEGTVLFAGNDFYNIALIDHDNNGFLDVVTAINNGPARLMLFENFEGDLNDPIEIYQFDFAPSGWTTVNNIVTVDINNDNKKDLLIDSIYDEQDTVKNISWLENIDGQGTFSQPQNIDNDFTYSNSLRTYDLDDDGDFDILAAMYEFNHLENSTVVWYQNLDGQGDFGEQQIISTEVFRVVDAMAADLNGDGDLDVISASRTDNKVAWYENTGVLGVSENELYETVLFPNPSEGIINIQSAEPVSKIEVYTLLGEKLKTFSNSEEIDISVFSSGLYLVKLIDDDGNSEIQKVIKE